MSSMAFACLLLTAALLASSVELVCVAMIMFVMAFGLGLGPVAWLLPAELFPMPQRAAATSVTTLINWLANFTVGQLFLLMAGCLGPFSFLPFAAVLCFGWLFARQSTQSKRCAIPTVTWLRGFREPEERGIRREGRRNGMRAHKLPSFAQAPSQRLEVEPSNRSRPSLNASTKCAARDGVDLAIRRVGQLSLLS